MSEIKETVKDLEKVVDTKEKLKELSPYKFYNNMKDADLMDELFKRGIDIPVDEHNKLVRPIAIKKVIKWDDAARPLNSYRKMKVIFHRSGREGEAPYVFLSLNGVAYQIPYEKEVELPEPVIRGCADNAVTTEYEFTGINDKGSATYNERVVRACPYTFLGYVED
ncbi:MAG: hypothetical protein AMQ22_00928 [Candidatus Methanofastidiosum methylothiophilum]|jgi:hypothetical protein|uniref:Uncharacterized protein n=1 Tax=Candidatus Methanofastidiosum methylothiophilum TaxID=1705564 RepID=A0A150J4R9_9EURY|nr:MAG: hypothetical protein AMQ22_00928 [Candidatus Methanofastidiosum methylthiophilus]